MINEKIAVIVTLIFLSTSTFAFQSEINLDYSTGGDFDIKSIAYRYHFTLVDLGNTAWAEAPFMNRSSFVTVEAARSDFDDGSSNGFGVNGRAQVSDDMYIEGTYLDIEEINSKAIEAGYYYEKNHTVFLQYRTDDLIIAEADTFALGIKNIKSLGNGKFFNLEVGVSRSSIDVKYMGIEDGGDFTLLNLGGDYYFTEKTSLGLDIILFDDTNVDTDYTLAFKHYFNEKTALSLSFNESGGDGSTTSVGLSFRF